MIVAQTDVTQAAEVIGRTALVNDSPEYRTLVASLDLLVVRPAPPLTVPYLYGLLQSHAFHSHALARVNGTTVLHMQRMRYKSSGSPYPPTGHRQFRARGYPAYLQVGQQRQRFPYPGRLAGCVTAEVGVGGGKSEVCNSGYEWEVLMALIPPGYLNTVVALGGPSEDGTMKYTATGFLYGHPAGVSNENGQPTYRLFLVTNRHVLQKASMNRAELHARFNRPMGADPNIYAIPLKETDGSDSWIVHPRPDADVAVITINHKRLQDDGIEFVFFEGDQAAFNARPSS